MCVCGGGGVISEAHLAISRLQGNMLYLKPIQLFLGYKVTCCILYSFSDK